MASCSIPETLGRCSPCGSAGQTSTSSRPVSRSRGRETGSRHESLQSCFQSSNPTPPIRPIREFLESVPVQHRVSYDRKWQHSHTVGQGVRWAPSPSEGPQHWDRGEMCTTQQRAPNGVCSEPEMSQLMKASDSRICAKPIMAEHP